MSALYAYSRLHSRVLHIQKLYKTCMVINYMVCELDVKARFGKAPLRKGCPRSAITSHLQPRPPRHHAILSAQGGAPWIACSYGPVMVRRCAKPLDIIGGSVYWLYAHLCDLTRQTARVPGCDRTDARRVCAGAAGLCCGLCR